MLTDYSYRATAIYFILGGAVTAIFSGSLVRLAHAASPGEVLVVGMIVPSFTWLVHLLASARLLPVDLRRCYWGDLARVCLIGSIALLPAAAFNFLAVAPALWPSVANVLASVVVMAVCLFALSAAHNISSKWPASWCLTIACNMALFATVSRSWWGN